MDLIYLAPDPVLPLKTPREREERHPLSNLGWSWTQLIVTVLVLFTVLFTAAFAEFVARTTEVPLQTNNLQQEQDQYRRESR